MLQLCKDIDGLCLLCCADTLNNISAAMAEGGFLLLYEMTCSVPMFLWGLDARTWTFTDEREYSLWMARPRWHQILKEAGLEMVCEHWCASLTITSSITVWHSCPQ